MHSSRATYVGGDRTDSQFPRWGSMGLAWAASGFDDPESIEFGAYLFQPDGCRNAYYCDPKKDLVFEYGRR